MEKEKVKEPIPCRLIEITPDALILEILDSSGFSFGEKDQTEDVYKDKLRLDFGFSVTKGENDG
jgi:hypothetical protein